MSKHWVDYERLIKAVILKDLPKAILSDISLETKKYIKKTSPGLWQKTYRSALNELEQHVPEKWRREFIESIETAKDDSLEGSIVAFSDLYSAYKECEVNQRIFGEYYNETFLELEESLYNDYDAGIFNAFLNNQRLQAYMVQIRTLLSSVRWNQINRNVKSTVAGHTYFVTFMAILLTYISKTVTKTPLNCEETLLKAAYHDVPESITGDIISPTKRRIQGFENTISQVEEQMVDEKLIHLLPGGIQEDLKRYMLLPFEGEGGRLVKAADLFGSLYECLIEMNTGNAYPLFKTAYRDIMRELKMMKTQEVDYIIKWGIVGNSA